MRFSDLYGRSNGLLVVFAALLSIGLTADLLSAQAVVKSEAAAPEVVATDLPADAPKLQSQFVSGIRQLTFEGRRAGEGYFSKDGRHLVFQSEREPGNPFFQIYLMDRETGDVNRVSPGRGKTTCAWISPAGDKVLTHRLSTILKRLRSSWLSTSCESRRTSHVTVGIMIRITSL